MGEVQPAVESPREDQGRTTIPSPPSAQSSTPRQTNRLQGWLIIVLLCAILAVGAALAYFAATNQFSSPKYEQNTTALLKQLSSSKYEFKTLEVYGSGPKRTGSGAFKFTSITLDASQLNTLGAKGWEVVGTYLEMETAWPNFGSAKYVTGIQPNVRTQRVVMVLQRRLPLAD